jgi:hypothetical protein
MPASSKARQWRMKLWIMMVSLGGGASRYAKSALMKQLRYRAVEQKTLSSP